MFGFFTRGSRAGNPVSRRRARPSVEALEQRDCPAAPQITLSATMLHGRMVRLSGTVIDENPAGVTVTFSGVASGQTVPEPSGGYSLEVQADQLGTVFAQAVDEELLGSSPASAELASAIPVISSFQAVRQGDTDWVFSGYVADESPAGLVVRFGGLASLEWLQATVDATGWFSLLVTMEEGEEGTATAQVTDPWGLESNLAMTLVRP